MENSAHYVCLKLKKKKKYEKKGNNASKLTYQVPSFTIPCAAAATGTGRAVENMNERPLDCMSCFHFLLFNRLTVNS